MAKKAKAAAPKKARATKAAASEPAGETYTLLVSGIRHRERSEQLQALASLKSSAFQEVMQRVREWCDAAIHHGEHLDDLKAAIDNRVEEE